MYSRCAMPGGRPYLDFLRIPDMGRKPRDRGILIVSDFAPGHRTVEDILATRSEIIDYAKIPDHVGNIAFYDEAWFRERIALYHRHDIKVFPGGVTFEVAEVQGQSEKFFESLKAIGMDGVEVSTDVIEAPTPARRTYLIRLAKEMGFIVFTEVGKKDPVGLMDVDQAVEEIRANLEAGSYKVTIENSEIVLMMKEDPGRLERIVNAVGLEHVSFEVTPAGFPDLAVFLIRTFGPGVNIENIDFAQLIAVDQMRRGMNRAVSYGFLSEPDQWPDLARSRAKEPAGRRSR
jgi:phosphosulfolactate synthase